MKDTFDLRKFLTENKVTAASQQVDEIFGWSKKEKEEKARKEEGEARKKDRTVEKTLKTMKDTTNKMLVKAKELEASSPIFEDLSSIILSNIDDSLSRKDSWVRQALFTNGWSPKQIMDHHFSRVIQRTCSDIEHSNIVGHYLEHNKGYKIRYGDFSYHTDTDGFLDYSSYTIIDGKKCYIIQIIHTLLKPLFDSVGVVPKENYLKIKIPI